MILILSCGPGLLIYGLSLFILSRMETAALRAHSQIWVLARSEKSSQRFYSMSAQIRIERKTYYEMLEKTQKDGLDITPWLEWFLGCLDRAFDATEKTLGSVLRKARFWESACTHIFNDRQRLMLNKLLDGFEGKLTSSKWATIAKCSQDTALRDILDLVERGVLAKDPGGGRSTSYSLALPDKP